MTEIEIPRNIEAEISVLGSILINQKSIYTTKTAPSDFYESKHSVIFSAMADMAKKIERIDVVTLAEELENRNQLDAVGGRAYLASLVNQTVNANHIGHYAKIIKDKSYLRKLLDVGTAIRSLVQSSGPAEGILAKANQLLYAIREDQSSGKTAKELVRMYEDESVIQQNKKGYIGIPSGLLPIDEVIDGIRPGHLWIVGGYTSSGKSFFALNIVQHLLTQKKRVVFYSLEMSQLDLTQRLISLISGINGTKAMKSRIPEEIELIDTAKGMIYESDLTIYQGLSDWDKIKLSILEENTKNPVDCVFIDYLQLILSREKSEYDTLRVVSSELQALAQELGVPVIALSQVSNEQAKNESIVIGYKGSGNIAASADLAIELRNDEPDQQSLREKIERGEPYLIKVLVRKNRHGRVGSWQGLFSTTNGRITL